VKYKGFDVLIEAARFIDSEIVIVGEGIGRPALAEQIATAGLSHRVKLIGNLPQADLIELMSSAEIFAFPSVSAAETFGIAQIEAMACGCAIVNTHIPTAVPDVARHDIEAITVQPNDAGALAQAINLLLDNTAMRKRLSTNARARAVALYDQRNYELKLSSLLSRVSNGDAHDG
jgi:rhamnosyl/mannosyltransferase